MSLRTRRTITVTGLALSVGFTCVAPANAVADELLLARVAAPACGTVLLAGSNWLGGSGVDVHSNGATQGGRSCAGSSYANYAVQAGGGWQCVELATRLYYVKKWGPVGTGGNGGARYIPEGSPGLEFHPNGSGYTPVGGDLVVEAFGTYGHVTVVDHISGGVIYAVEQNANVTGWHTYGWSANIATGAYNGGVLRGFMHSPFNNARPVAPVAPPQIKSAGVAVTSRDLTLRWKAGSSVDRFLVQLKRRDVRGGHWSNGVSLSAQARRFRVEITHGKVYRLRLAAFNQSGRGPWWGSRTLRP